MEQIKFINNRNQEVILGQHKPYLLQNITGLGSPKTNIKTQIAPYQDGASYIHSTLQERELKCNVVIVATQDGTDLEEQIYNLRRHICSTLNPKLGIGKLVYTYDGGKTKEVGCYVSSPPMFPSGKNSKGLGFQEVNFTLKAPNPYWLDSYVSGEVMSQSIAKFEFDLELSDMFEFETDGTNRTVIDNVGDVSTPVRIVFKAGTGSITNPKVINVTTGEFIQVNKVLSQGQSLIITTDFDNKKVMFDDGSGNITSAFGLIDLDSTFWSLEIGTNEISYEVGSGLSQADVLVQYSNRYIGV